MPKLVSGRVVNTSIGWSPSSVMNVTRAPSLKALAEGADVLTLHMVLSDRSRDLVTADVFAALPPGAIFLNTSRAGLMSREGLLAWLAQDPTAMAGIDVFETEPLPADDPWRKAAANPRGMQGYAAGR